MGAVSRDFGPSLVAVGCERERLCQRKSIVEQTTDQLINQDFKLHDFHNQRMELK